MVKVGVMKKFLNYLAILVGTLLAVGCVSTPSPEEEHFSFAPTENTVIKFSEMVPTESDTDKPDQMKGWYPWTLLPKKNKTVYSLQNHQGKTVVHADAKSSASGLIVPLKARRIQGIDIKWSWKALNIIENADNSQGHTDDAPLRLVLAFDGDKSKLSFKDQMAFELAELISGHKMPYATLMYIWAGKDELNHVITNKYTTRMKLVVVDRGDQFLGDWRNHRRYIEADFKEAFHENPGRLIGIGIMTDSDNTKSNVRAIYGDIELLQHSSQLAEKISR